MITPLRRNVLVDMGPPTLLSDIIEIPKICQGIGMKGTVIATGAKCQHGLRPGDKVLVNRFADAERILSPDYCGKSGMAPHTHVLVPEDKVAATHE